MNELTGIEMRSESSGIAEARSDKFTIALMFLSGFALFAALLIFISAVYFDTDRQEVIKKRAMGNLEVQQFRQAQQQRLNEYRWIDQSSGVVGIPVERAIEVLINEMNGDLTNQTSEQQE